MSGDGPFDLGSCRGALADGQLDGDFHAFDEAGQPIHSASYRCGVLHGPMRIFTDGKQVMESHYENGRLTGIQTVRGASGAAVAEISWRDGLRHGPARFYDSEGSLIREDVYDAGQLQPAPPLPAASAEPAAPARKPGWIKALLGAKA